MPPGLAPLEPHPLRAYRERRGLSISELARRAGLSVATVSRVEAGGVDLPTMAVIIKLAMACEGEVSELDIVRYSFARSVGVVLPLRAPMTSDFTWNWVRPSTEGATPVLV